MGKLGDIYDNIENPLNNPNVLKQIVSAYSKSNRTSVFGCSDLYSSMVKMNQSKDNSSINARDKEIFLVETYNQWIENIINLDQKHIDYLEKSKGMNAGKIQEYLKNFGKVTSMEDIKKLKSNPLFENELNNWELNDGWEHIKSQYISARTENRIPVKHRLYVGCQNQDMWKLAKIFKNKCEEKQIPFYFKLGASNDRDDKMVIYADTDNLGNYVTALQEIAQENPEMLQRMGEPPAMTGKIDGWIGIGDEPPKKENGKNQSYNSLRANVFENAIEETLLTEISEFKGKHGKYKNEETKFNDLFIEQAAETILQRLDKNKSRQSTKLSNYGLNENDIRNPKFKEYIEKHLRKTIQKGLDKLVEVKDKKEQLGGSNETKIFDIPTREGKFISINTYDMDLIIKNMVPIMQEIDTNFMEKVKNQIQENCKQSGIDDTFCFQQGTKEKFKQEDLATKNKEDRKRANKDAHSNNLQSAFSEIENKNQEKRLSSKEIIDSIDSNILVQRVELPNGAQISAKQYIEEYILGEGQQKDKEDILEILAENNININRTTEIEEKPKEVKRKINMKDLKAGILESKIASSETKKQMDNMQQYKKIRILIKKYERGEILKTEKRLVAEENIRKIQKENNDFKQKRENNGERIEF